jgi:hypothetical protein
MKFGFIAKHRGIWPTSVNLSGSVTNPGQYTLSDLQNNFTPVHETVGTDV